MAGARKPILVVDDDEDTRYALVQILRMEGYATAEVGTGAAALDYLRDGKPACAVILDMMLPDMSGADVRAALARDPGLAAIPVIAFSALDDEGLMPGVVAYVRKGLDVDVLLAAVAKACGARR